MPARPRPDAAWKLLSYVVGEEGQTRMTETGLLLPSRKSVESQIGACVMVRDGHWRSSSGTAARSNTIATISTTASAARFRHLDPNSNSGF